MPVALVVQGILDQMAALRPDTHGQLTATGAREQAKAFAPPPPANAQAAQALRTHFRGSEARLWRFSPRGDAPVLFRVECRAFVPPAD